MMCSHLAVEGWERMCTSSMSNSVLLLEAFLGKKKNLDFLDFLGILEFGNSD